MEIDPADFSSLKKYLLIMKIPERKNRNPPQLKIVHAYIWTIGSRLKNTIDPIKYIDAPSPAKVSTRNPSISYWIVAQILPFSEPYFTTLRIFQLWANTMINEAAINT